jgi:hypothetical protein
LNETNEFFKEGFSSNFEKVGDLFGIPHHFNFLYGIKTEGESDGKPRVSFTIAQH